MALVVALGVAMSSPASGQTLGQATRTAGTGGAAVGSALGAVVGGTLGFLGGLALGATGDCYEICGGMIWGALGGEALGVAVGAHFGNRARGRFLADLATSVLAGGAGVAIAANSSSENAFWTLVAAQVAATVIVELNTSADVSVSGGPRLIEGRPGFGATLRF
jgi:hypothetical protein